MLAINRTTRPASRDPCAAPVEIGGPEAAAGLFDQRLGDEKAQPHPLLAGVSRCWFQLGFRHGVAARPRGYVRFADALDDVRREAGPIVFHCHPKLFGIPNSADSYPRLGEIGGI